MGRHTYMYGGHMAARPAKCAAETPYGDHTVAVWANGSNIFNVSGGLMRLPTAKSRVTSDKYG